MNVELRKKVNRELLHRLYWEEGRSIYKIAQLLGTTYGTLYYWFEKFAIPRRSRQVTHKPSLETVKRLYLEEGYSVKDIASIFGIAPTTMRRYLHKLGIPTRQRNTYTERRKKLLSEAIARTWERKETRERRLQKIGNYRHITPNLSPTNDLAYILGVILGDGCITNKNREVVLYVKDLPFAESFAEALRNIGLHPGTYENPDLKGRPMYVTYAWSKTFCEWYKTLTLDDIRKMLGDNKHFILAFLRGFYESEGSLAFKKGKPVALMMYNKNPNLLYFIKELMNKLNYHCTLTWRRNGVGQINLHRRAEILRFLEETKPCIKTSPRPRRRQYV